MGALLGWARLVLVGSVLTVSRAEPWPQTTVPTPPPLVLSSMAGGDLFRFYCASCHGADGRGHGPVAASLRTAPSDLTALSRRHGGSFPRHDAERYLAGDEVPPVAAHGAKEMPVWGPIFRALDPDERTRNVRVANIIDYLESMQVK
jgi:mono/diheme cytochrome c family protein